VSGPVVTAERLLSREDLDFLLFDWLDAIDLTSRDRFAEHSRETFDALLDLSAQLASDQFASHNTLADEHEPVMGADGKLELPPEVGIALKAFIESGLLAAPFDEAHGGGQLPNLLTRACLVWFQAANAGTSSYVLLTLANAALLAKHGSDDLLRTWLPSLLDGSAFGTMCISEPDVGSSLADITTQARRTEDGSYLVQGTKMWISGGDHDLSDNIVHLVLARTGSPEDGSRGLSLILVPKILSDGRRNAVTLIGLNHKMGNRATTNTVLAFGDDETPGSAPGAVGYLVGEEGRGLHVMFTMMNDARVGVGFLAAGLGYTGYLRSLEYASSRRQGRPTAAADRRFAPVPLIEHADVRRMLLAQKSYVEGGLALCLFAAKLVDDEATAPVPAQRFRATRLLELLTPIAKSWPAQWCLEANSLAIQVHGGYGYARDFGIEQLYRDNRLNAIHEGTHGIQALDLLGRKVLADDGQRLREVVALITDTVQRAEQSERLRDLAVPVQAAASRLLAVTDVLAAAPREVALALASTYLEAMGHLVVAWLWLDQAVAVDQRQDRFSQGKRAAAAYFITWELPRTAPQLDLLERLDTTVLDTSQDVL